jgi:hypothetical protein
MRHPLAFLCLALTMAQAAPSVAETPMGAAEFDAYVTGKTLTYAEAGVVFGTEQYLPNRRVRWAFTDDICQFGRWYEQDGRICFVYDHDPTPQCWQFWRSDTGLRARFASDQEGRELTEVQDSDQPLACAGPEVGV